jgi:hypothetical protein
MRKLLWLFPSFFLEKITKKIKLKDFYAISIFFINLTIQQSNNPTIQQSNNPTIQQSNKYVTNILVQ